MCLSLLIGAFNIGMAHSSLSINIKGEDPIDAVKKIVLKHLDGSAHRDIAKMDAVLQDNFRIVVNDVNKGAVMALDKKTMLGLYEQGKFGGEVKEIDIISVDVQDNLNAVVKVKETGKKAIFHEYFTLVQIGGEWKIIGELAYLEYLN